MVEEFFALCHRRASVTSALYRDHATLQPVDYYYRSRETPRSGFLLLDPMLATGGSAAAASGDHSKGQGANRIRFLASWQRRKESGIWARRIRTCRSGAQLSTGS